MNQPKRLAITLAALVTTAIALAGGAALLNTGKAIEQQQKLRSLQAHQRLLDTARQLKAQDSYAACAEEIRPIRPDSPLYRQAQILAHQCSNALSALLLADADLQAAHGYLSRAVAIAQTASGPDYEQLVRQRVRTWSARILQLADEAYQAGRFSEAMRFAGAIDLQNPLYAEAQTRMRRWQAEWDVNQRLWREAEAALAKADVETALRVVQQVNHPAFQAQVDTAVRSIRIRQRHLHYENLIEQALTHLDRNRPEQARQAAQQLPDEPPWLDRKAQLFEQIAAAQQRTNTLAKLIWSLGSASLFTYTVLKL